MRRVVLARDAELPYSAMSLGPTRPSFSRFVNFPRNLWMLWKTQVLRALHLWTTPSRALRTRGPPDSIAPARAHHSGALDNVKGQFARTGAADGAKSVPVSEFSTSSVGFVRWAGRERLSSERILALGASERVPRWLPDRGASSWRAWTHRSWGWKVRRVSEGFSTTVETIVDSSGNRRSGPSLVEVQPRGDGRGDGF